MKGIYTLVIHVKKSLEIKVGRLGHFSIKKGMYFYTGSAMGKGACSLEGRLKRHYRKKKKPFWHIDHVLQRKDAHAIWAVCSTTVRSLECEVNKKLRERMQVAFPIKGFGSSDCECESHFALLDGSAGIRDVLRVLSITYQACGLRPMLWNPKSGFLPVILC